MRAMSKQPDAAEVASRLPPASQTTARDFTAKPPLRILVVEDDLLIGMLLADMLGEMGHVVCAVESTESDAIAAAARHTPDMMIVDARLHEGDGISAMQHILGVRYVPHVFVSGDIRGVMKSRPDAIVIEKPFTEMTLARAIERAQLPR